GLDGGHDRQFDQCRAVADGSAVAALQPGRCAPVETRLASPRRLSCWLRHRCRRALHDGRLGVVVARDSIRRGLGVRSACGPSMKGHSMKWLTVLVIVIAVAASILAALLYAAGGREDDNANLTRFAALFQKQSDAYYT